MGMCILEPVAKTKRVQVLMDPAEFRQLEGLARKRRSSVSELMREATRVQLLHGLERGRRVAAAHAFLDLPDAPLPDWAELKEELEERRG